MALGDVIARLSVSLGLETAAFEKGSKRAAKEVSGLEASMARIGKVAGAIGTAFLASGIYDLGKAWASATKDALEFAGGLGEQAQQVGVTTDALQEFRYVASQVGVSTEQMDAALAQFSKRLGGALVSGKGPFVDALKQIGLSLDDLRGKTTGEQFALIADGLNKVGDAAKQGYIETQLFGKAGQQLGPLFAEGAAGIDKMRAAAHELGIVISEEAIKNADKNADLVSTYEQIATAQKNVALTTPENVKAYMAFQKATTDLQIALYKTGAELFKLADGPWSERLKAALDISAEYFLRLPASASEMGVKVGQAIRNMVASIASSIGGTLRAVWDGAIAKLGALGAKFAWLYDVVVGHSYVPDMVDGVAAEMARLDSVMVRPADRATAAVGDEFKDLRDTLDRLFPEIGKADAFNADLARIQGSALNDNQKEEAARRLWREFLSGSPFGSGSGLGTPDFGDGANPLTDTDQAMRDLESTMDSLGKKSKATTVQIADSFKDMADKTLQSLGRLTSAIKDGGFLGILEGVIGLGLQLGSVGAFGKGIQTRLNAVPKYADGTGFHPGGLALVGERGPELVSMPRGSKVIPNGRFGGDTYYIEGNLLTPEFWAHIQSGDVAAAQAGARGGEARMAFKQSRRVG